MSQETQMQFSSETHDMYWLKIGRVLYVNCKGHQTIETIQASLDDIAQQCDHANQPVMILVNWLETTHLDAGALLNQQGHRAFSHPMAARTVSVGLNPQQAFENEVAAVKTRRSKNTQYFHTLEEAMDYLDPMIHMD